MGAPVLYTDEERKAIKKMENDYNYNIRRNKLIEEVRKTNIEVKDDFINGLRSLAICDFDYFVTLTIDPKSVGKNNLLQQLQDDEIRTLLVHFPDMEKYLTANKPKRQSIEFVQNVGTAYFNFLVCEGIVTNVLTAIEKDKSGKWHIHALISSRHINIVNLVQAKWFYGIANIAKIGDGKYDNGDTMVQHRENIISYMYQTFNPTSTSNQQQKRLDYWYLYRYHFSANEVNAPTNTIPIAKEIDWLNGRFKYDGTIGENNKKQGSISDLLTGNGAILSKSLNLSQMALFYLLTIIMLFK